MSNEISTSSLNEFYTSYMSSQRQISSYPIHLINIRYQMINWLSFISQSLHFKHETLFRAISIFDMYTSKASNLSQDNIRELKLIAIASLNLSTKIEEINCNYIHFFVDKVLNANQNDNLYSSKELSSIETKILKRLNFKINHSTAFQFITIYHSIFEIIFKQHHLSTKTLMWLKKTSLQILLDSIKDSNSICMNVNEIALYAINCTLNKMNSKCNAVNKLNEIILLYMCYLQKITSYSKEENNLSTIISVNPIYNL